MSVQAIHAVWQIRGLTTPERLVLLCIADHINNGTGKAWPSISRIANQTEIKDQRHIRRVIQGLASKGALGIERSAGKGNIYSLTQGPQTPGVTPPQGLDTPGLQTPHPGSTDPGTQGCATRGPRVPTPPEPERTVNEPEENQKTKRFSPPTVAEVRAYCVERNNAVDPEAFIDHYTSNGWKVGKASMKNWKAAVRTWERNDGGRRTRTPAGGGSQAAGAGDPQARREARASREFTETHEPGSAMFERDGR
jgi:hypothetical protein